MENFLQFLAREAKHDIGLTRDFNRIRREAWIAEKKARQETIIIVSRFVKALEKATNTKLKFSITKTLMISPAIDEKLKAVDDFKDIIIHPYYYVPYKGNRWVTIKEHVGFLRNKKIAEIMLYSYEGYIGFNISIFKKEYETSIINLLSHYEKLLKRFYKMDVRVGIENKY